MKEHRARLATVVGSLLLIVFAGPSKNLHAQTSPAGPDVTQGPTLAPVNNRLPEWLELGGEFRFRFENLGGLGYVAGNDDAYGLARTRLNIEIRIRSWLALFAEGQDSRAPGIREEASSNGKFRDEADLRQAYVRFGRAESGPITLTVGRQLLLYGDQRLIGPLDWTNTARSWDAVRLELRPARNLKFDLFASAPVSITPGRQINKSVDGTNLHGVYGSIGSLLPASTIEPFVLWKTNSSVVGESGTAGDMDRYSAGARIAGTGIAGLDYSVTFVDQWGHYADSTIDAWAYSLVMGYAFPVPAAPRAYIEYNFGSGDTDAGDGQIGGFDDVYPTAHPYYGYNDLVGWRNIRNLRLGTRLEPFDRLGIRLDYHGFWLAEGNDSLYDAGGNVTVRPPPGGAPNSKVGDEVDLTFDVDITPTLSAGGGIGHMFPGPFLEANSAGAGNTFTFLFFGYEF